MKGCKEAETKDELVPSAIRARPVTQYIRQDAQTVILNECPINVR